MVDIQSTLKNTYRKPYIYKVTNVETGWYYIGSQCSGKTIGVNYFTSSTNKEFKKEFKTYGEEKYEIEIIKTFEDPEECVRVENYIIRNYMLLKDGLCLNKFYCCNGKKVFSTVGQSAWNKGQKGLPSPYKGLHHSEETKRKMSEAHKGLHLSEEERQKRSITLKGRHHTEEARKRMSEANKNRIKISIEDTTFDSITEASKYYNVYKPTIIYWVKNKKHNAFYIEKYARD